MWMIVDLYQKSKKITVIKWLKNREAEAIIKSSLSFFIGNLDGAVLQVERKILHHYVILTVNYLMPYVFRV